MNKKHALIAVAILIMLGGVAWALFSGEDVAVIEARQKRDELFKKIDTLTPEQRRAEFEALRESSRNLTEAQRRELRGGGRQFMMQRMDHLLAMAPAERNQELDRWIDRMEEGRQNREASGDQGEARRGGDRGGNMTEAQRDQRRKERLDRSSPEMRAKMDRMKDLINDRREQRGLEPIQGGGPRLFGRGPR